MLKSPAATITSPLTPAIDESAMLFPNQVPLIGLVDIGKLTVLKAVLESAIRLLTLTEIGECVLLTGTETDNSVVDAEFTTAFVLPK